MEQKFRRLLTAFRPESERRVLEIDVGQIPFEKLVDIFQPTAEDPFLFLGYPIGKDRAAALQPYLDDQLELDQYEYFLEVEA